MTFQLQPFNAGQVAQMLPQQHSSGGGARHAALPVAPLDLEPYAAYLSGGGAGSAGGTGGSPLRLDGGGGGAASAQPGSVGGMGGLGGMPWGNMLSALGRSLMTSDARAPLSGYAAAFDGLQQRSAQQQQQEKARQASKALYRMAGFSEEQAETFSHNPEMQRYALDWMKERQAREREERIQAQDAEYIRRLREREGGDEPSAPFAPTQPLTPVQPGAGTDGAPPPLGVFPDASEAQPAPAAPVQPVQDAETQTMPSLLPAPGTPEANAEISRRRREVEARQARISNLRTEFERSETARRNPAAKAEYEGRIRREEERLARAQAIIDELTPARPDFGNIQTMTKDFEDQTEPHAEVFRRRAEMARLLDMKSAPSDTLMVKTLERMFDPRMRRPGSGEDGELMGSSFLDLAMRRWELFKEGNLATEQFKADVKAIADAYAEVYESDFLSLSDATRSRTSYMFPEKNADDTILARRNSQYQQYLRARQRWERGEEPAAPSSPLQPGETRETEDGVIIRRVN